MKSKHKLLVVALLAALVTTLAPISCEAQQSTLSGRVAEEGTGQPVGGIALGVGRVSMLRAEQPGRLGYVPALERRVPGSAPESRLWSVSIGRA